MRISDTVINAARQAFEESSGSITASGLKPILLERTGEDVRTSTAEYILSRIRKEVRDASESTQGPLRLVSQYLRQEFNVPISEFLTMLGLGDKRLMSIGLDEDSVIIETEQRA